MNAVKEKTVLEENKSEQPTDGKKRSKAGSKRFIIFIAVYAAVVILLNVLAKSRSFADFYTDHIFGIWSDTYGRLTGIFPFSVGEILIAAAVILLLAMLVISVALVFMRKLEKLGSFAVKYLKFVLVTFLSVVLVMTLNCNIPYSCSKLDIKGHRGKTYTTEQILIVRNHFIEECASLAEKMERDENGAIVFRGDTDAEVRKAMQSLSEEYPRFKGYYPKPKGILGSYFMYQSNIIGVYFPFSMEANYSRYLSSSFYPNTTAHELSHLKGYMFEDEANFFSFLACTSSECDYVRYSGYLGALYYIDNDYYARVDDETYLKQPQIPDIVRFDDNCYDSETVKALEKKKPVVKDEVMEEINETITDTYMSYYDVTPNYSEVTFLILQYYDGILF